MRIVSLNAWGGAVFEEVTRTAELQGWTHFADGERKLPQRANLFDDVRALLPRHQAAFVASDAGPVKDAAGHLHRQDFGIAMFIDESIPVIGTSAAFVHGSFVDHVEWPMVDRPRVAQGARLVDRVSGRTISVAHLHGLRDPDGKADTPARQAQAERLAAFITQLRMPSDLVVVGGDLNLLPDSQTFDILGTIGLIDLVGEKDTRTSLYPKQGRHANYLLVTEPGQVKCFETPARPEVSDHRPLVLDL